MNTTYLDTNETLRDLVNQNLVQAGAKVRSSNGLIFTVNNIVDGKVKLLCNITDANGSIHDSLTLSINNNATLGEQIENFLIANDLNNGPILNLNNNDSNNLSTYNQSENDYNNYNQNLNNLSNEYELGNNQNNNNLLNVNNNIYANPTYFGEAIQQRINELYNKIWNEGEWKEAAEKECDAQNHVTLKKYHEKKIQLNTNHGTLNFQVRVFDDKGVKLIRVMCKSDTTMSADSRMYGNLIALYTAMACVNRNGIQGIVKADEMELTVEQANKNRAFCNLVNAIKLCADKHIPIYDQNNKIGIWVPIDAAISNLESSELRNCLMFLRQNGCEYLKIHYKMREVSQEILNDEPDYCCFDAVLPPDGTTLDLFDVKGYDINCLIQPIEPEVQYVEEPQIQYVEEPQIQYVEQPQIEYAEQSQKFGVPTAYNTYGMGQEYTVGTPSPQFKRIGVTAQAVAVMPIPVVQMMEKVYKNYLKIYPQQQMMQQPVRVPGPVSVATTVTRAEGPEEVDITVGRKAPKRVVKKKRKKVRSRQASNFYNIRADVKESGGMAVPAGQTAAPAAANPQVVTTPNQKSPLVILADTQKIEPLKANDNVKVILEHAPVKDDLKLELHHQPVKDDVKFTIDHKDIVDELKVLIEQKGQEQAKTMKDIVDDIKVTIENNQDIPKEKLQLYDKILVEIDKIAQNTPEISVDFNNDDVLKEIGSLKDKIDNLKRDDIVVSDNISVDLNQLEEVNGRLASIESRLDAMKTPSEATKSMDEVKVEVQNLKEKYPEFVVDYPDLQQVTDKLSLLIEEKFKDLKINDKVEVNQTIPEIAIDIPGVNVNDKIEVKNGEKPVEQTVEKPRDMIVNDKVEVNQPDIVVDQNDLSGLQSAIDEMKKTIVNVKDDINIQIEQKLKDLHVNDKVEVNQAIPEIAIDIPDVNVNDKIEVKNGEKPVEQTVEKPRDMIVNDKVEVNQTIPEIAIDVPDVNVNDKIEVKNGEKPRDMIVNDKVEVNQPDIVVEQNDLSGVTSAINELKKTMVNVKDDINIQIEQKLKDLKINDKIEINQAIPEIAVDIPDVKINDKIEFNHNEPVKKDNDEIVITNEYIEKTEPKNEVVVDKPVKKDDDEIVITNEYIEKTEPKEETIEVTTESIEKREPVMQGNMPAPMPGFMMMPPFVMPPPMPMPMPMPAQQPQQPIIITQNQSDEEEGHSFWSNFWKVLLILLLLASIIGLGFLMWKNMQKNNEQKHEPEHKPEPDQKPDPKPEPTPERQDEIKITPQDPVRPGPIATNEGQTVQPVCPDGKSIQLNVDADKVNLGGDVGQMTQSAKDAINMENVGVRNQLIGENGNTIDTSRLILKDGKIEAVEWGDITKNPTIYKGELQDGKAIINGQTYTIADKNGQAYSQGAINIAEQTNYNRNGDGSLSTDFGTLKQDLQINKNNTFTLNTNTANGTTIASNTLSDISGNETIKGILNDKLNDSSLTQGEYNRIMDALDDGKLNDSYFQSINNNTTYSLDNSNSIGNGAGY